MPAVLTVARGGRQAIPMSAVTSAPRKKLPIARLAIAAMVLIACGVFWPMVGGLRMDARRTAGENNMHRAALGFGLFAHDHDDQMPAAKNRGLEGVWWEVGTPGKSHAANLYTLVRTGYVPLSSLASPGNPDAPTVAASPDASR